MDYSELIGPAALAVAGVYADKAGKQYIAQLGSNSNRKALDLAAGYIGTFGLRHVPSHYRGMAMGAAAAAVFDLTRLFAAPHLDGGTAQAHVGGVVDYVEIPTTAAPAAVASDSSEWGDDQDAYSMAAAEF